MAGFRVVPKFWLWILGAVIYFFYSEKTAKIAVKLINLSGLKIEENSVTIDAIILDINIASSCN